MSQDFENHFVENMKLLAEIRRTQPSTSHVYVQRIKKGIDIGWVDIPVAQAEMTLKTHPEWILLTSNKQMDDVVEKLFADEPEDTIVIPPKPSEEVGVSDDSHAHAAPGDTPTSLEDASQTIPGGEAPLLPPETDSDVLNPPPPTEKVAPPPAAPKRAAKKTHARGKKRT